MDTEFEQLRKIGESTGGRNPVQESRYQELLKTQGNGGGAFDPIANAQKLLDFQRQANQPAIQSFQAQIPETSARFATQRSQLEGQINPTREKYDQLIKDITKRTETATAREFGRRGISLESGLFDTTLDERISPTVERVGLEREGAVRDIQNLIANLTGQETDAVRAIQNAIAGLQTGQPTDAISAAMNILGMQQNQRQFEASQDLQRRQLEEYQIPSLGGQEQSPYITLGEGQSLYDLNTLQQIFKNPKTYKAEGGSNDPLGLGL